MAKPLDLGLVLGLNHGMGLIWCSEGWIWMDPWVNMCTPKMRHRDDMLATPDSQMITLESHVSGYG